MFPNIVITETILAITLATSIWLLLCGSFSRAAAAATFQRAIWRTALVGAIVLALAELGGVTGGVHWWLQSRVKAGRSAERLIVSTLGVVSEPSADVSDRNVHIAFEHPLRQPNSIADANVFSVDFHANTTLDHDTTFDMASLGESTLGAARPEETHKRPYAVDSTAVSQIRNVTWPVSVIESIWRERRGVFLLVIWFLGTAALTAKIVWDHAALRWFQLRQPLLQEGDMIRRIRRLGDQLAVGRHVAVRSSDTLVAPVAFGTRRPTIVLPSAFTEEYSASQQDAVLAHELAHLAAHDPFWQLAANLACALIWWQPLAWLARKQLQLATEWAADEATTLIPNGPEFLAECLVHLGKRMAQGKRLLWLSAAGPRFRSGLGRRVTRLLSLESDSNSAVPRRSFQRVAIVSMLILSVSATSWARTHTLDNIGDMEMSILKSWRRSVVGAAVLAIAGLAGSNAPAINADEPSVEVELEAVAEDEFVEDVETEDIYADDADAEDFVDDLNRDAERRNVRNAITIFGDLVAAGEPDHEHQEHRHQFKDRERDEGRTNRAEEIHKRLHEAIAELPEDHRNEIAKLVEALLEVERSHVRHEIERGQVELELRLNEQARKAHEEARAFAEHAKQALQRELNSHRRQAFEQQQRVQQQQPRLQDYSDAPRQAYQLTAEAARHSDRDRQREFGKFEDQLHELREQMTQMHRQMRDMQHAMEKLMRSADDATQNR